MLTIERLNEYGANTAEGLERCMNNEAFYLRMVGMALNEPSFGKLRPSIESGDLAEAFEAAHALKGILANLALTPLQKPVSELTELLRARTEIDYGPYLAEIEALKNKLDTIATE